MSGRQGRIRKSGFFSPRFNLPIESHEPSAWNRESRSCELRSLHPGYGAAGVGILPKERPSKSTAEKE